MTRTRRVVTVAVAALWWCALCRSATAQSFELSTNISEVAGLQSYAFALTYLSDPSGGSLQSDLFRWSFFVEPGDDPFLVVTDPTGWSHTYDPLSGEFAWYTEGPGGIANGDFGPFALEPGDVFGGFGVETQLLPRESVVFAEDTLHNIDLNLGVVPATAPAAVAEPSGVEAGLGIAVIAVLLARRHPRRQS
jgi:hypothetical protein